MKKINDFNFVILIIPIIIYFYFIHRFGINMISGDDWIFISVIQKFFSGNLSFSEIWAPINGHRVIFPDLYFIISAKFFHMNMKTNMYLGWVFLISSFLFLLKIYKRRVGPSLYPMIPVSFTIFTLSQWESTLMGDQISWYFIVFCFTGMLLLLEETGAKNWAFGAAITLAVFASFSSFEGLFLWWAGLVYIFYNRFNLYQKFIWIFFSFAITKIYFQGAEGEHVLLSYALSHLQISVEFLLIAVSSFFPITQTLQMFSAVSEHKNLIQACIGLSIFSLGIYALMLAAARVGKDKKFLAPLGILCFSLIYFASLTAGRVIVGLSAAMSSHYITFSMLFPLSIYLILLYVSNEKGKKTINILLILMSTLIILQFFQSLYLGLNGGRSSRSYYIYNARIISNINKIKDPLLLKITILKYISYFEDLDDFDKDIPFMREHKLSVFGSLKLPVYISEGLPRITLPKEKLLPVSNPLQIYIRRNPEACTAWYVVSFLYNSRWDLQLAFPLSSNTSLAKIVNWELNADKIHDLMSPYQKILLHMKKIIEINPGGTDNKSPDGAMCSQTGQYLGVRSGPLH